MTTLIALTSVSLVGAAGYLACIVADCVADTRRALVVARRIAPYRAAYRAAAR